MLGGSVSAATGGKFAAGAATAAFSRAFNDEARHEQQQSQKAALEASIPEDAGAVVVLGMRREGSRNIFGHIAIVIEEGGVFSFGTQTALGGSVSGYLNDQVKARDQAFIAVKTTPSQIQRMLRFLRVQKDDIGYVDTCANRVFQALRAGGIMMKPPINPSMPASVAGALMFTVHRGGASIIHVPQRGKLPDMSRFENKGQ